MMDVAPDDRMPEQMGFTGSARGDFLDEVAF
jgi:hypothetical protein